MRTILLLTAFAAVVSCGPRVSGEVGKACAASDRSAANPALCQCIQAVANQTLNGSEQARAATFFAEPQLAQDARAADGARDEAFWQRYRTFSRSAERSCR